LAAIAQRSFSRAKNCEKITPVSHPLQSGQIFYSPGGQFCYRVIGPCCRLFDREQLPWPCCRIEWRSKEPSWRRIGKRFVPDIATKTHPSYAVEILGQGRSRQFSVVTLYSVKLSPTEQEWWCSSTKPQRLSQLPETEAIADLVSST
jgi:hypothetical protein